MELSIVGLPVIGSGKNMLFNYQAGKRWASKNRGYHILICKNSI